MNTSDRISEAAGRVLGLAGSYAGGLERTEILMADLLCALWQDESRAHEILAQGGVTQSHVVDQVGREIWDVSARQTSNSVDPSTESVRLSADVQNTVQIAQSLAGQLGRHAEMGTEHLLMGLIECDESLRAWLEGQGVALEDLRRETADAQGLTDEPIAVDIALRPVVRTQRQTVRVDRILDAAANRVREGLRVVEDFVRFVLDDVHLSRLLKEHRHELTGTLLLLPGDRMLAARDTAGDVGTGIQTSAEQYREHAADVVRANCKRVEESLRSLEEYSKTVNGDAAARFEQLRYRFYTIEQAVSQTLRSRERLQDARLYLLVTDRLCTKGAGPLIRDALKGGVDVVQLREKEMPDARLLDLARSVREWTASADALFIVNDRPDIAALAEADGVHLGQDDMPVAAARQIVGGERLVGVSTHTIDQVRQAILDGADYLGVGPVFPSHTKQFTRFPGLEFVRQVAAETTRPWFPLGGIDQASVDKVLAAGADRIAVSAAVVAADDPEVAASNLRSAIP